MVDWPLNVLKRLPPSCPPTWMLSSTQSATSVTNIRLSYIATVAMLLAMRGSRHESSAVTGHGVLIKQLKNVSLSRELLAADLNARGVVASASERAGARGVAVLRTLVERYHQHVAKATIIDAAWPGVVVEERNLAVQIAAIRRVLSRTAGGEHWIETLSRARLSLRRAAHRTL
jgi:DNA-binding response OmpR family regulator